MKGRSKSVVLLQNQSEFPVKERRVRVANGWWRQLDQRHLPERSEQSEALRPDDDFCVLAISTFAHHWPRGRDHPANFHCVSTLNSVRVQFNKESALRVSVEVKSSRCRIAHPGSGREREGDDDNDDAAGQAADGPGRSISRSASSSSGSTGWNGMECGGASGPCWATFLRSLTKPQTPPFFLDPLFPHFSKHAAKVRSGHG